MGELREYTVGTVAEPGNTLPIERGIGVDTPGFAEKLLEIADEARKFSYCPYSKYSVGAALLCMDGSIYTGCNAETAAFTGICAERNAFFKAISEGKKGFLAIAVSGGPAELAAEECTPCGVCRQVMNEFVSPHDFAIITRDKEGKVKSYSLDELLPMSFGAGNLNI
ncbi:MAG: cytidine deaminase [Lachnospiraceae bacterium]|nr:cytidine deaminase [Lachnospiraceae bacterium]